MSLTVFEDFMRSESSMNQAMQKLWEKWYLSLQFAKVFSLFQNLVKGLTENGSQRQYLINVMSSISTTLVASTLISLYTKKTI